MNNNHREDLMKFLAGFLGSICIIIFFAFIGSPIFVSLKTHNWNWLWAYAILFPVLCGIGNMCDDE